MLRHEQGHFDIYEIYGREIMKQLKETKAMSGKNFSDNVEKIFRKGFADLNKLQKKYDQETNHSKNKEKQDEWTKKLKKMLDDRKDYKVKEVEFKV